MKKTLVVLTLALVLVFAFATGASAKYGSYLQEYPYLSWGGASALFQEVNGTEPAGTELSPHGGYTATTFKCVVCHSTHRADTDQTAIGVGTDRSLLAGTSGACSECHAAWGSNLSDALVEIGETYSGPHIGAGGISCTNRGCHGSVHGSGTPSKYAVAVRYNLTNGTLGLLDQQMDEAIAAGNVNFDGTINTTSTDQAMKAFVTGYVCYPCHGNSSFSVAARGYANPVTLGGALTYRTGHPSTGSHLNKWRPTCESCHDMIGVATKTTAFPHANRGIDVYKGRFDNYTQTPVFDENEIISSDNTVTTRYGLWMTSAEYHDNVNANPIVDVQNGYSLQDGVCIKCHEPNDLK